MRKAAMIIIALLVLLATIRVPAIADGGAIVSDYFIWKELEEGQQIGVVRLNEDGTVHTDLFISLIDHTGASHEITFFLPLGWGASDLRVVEEDSSHFESQFTDILNHNLGVVAAGRQQAANSVRLRLAAGSFLINGGWGWPLLALLALTACGAGVVPEPLQVLHTESSQVSIYSIEEDTDLAALVAVSGLDQAVQEVLRALTGQQVALVSLRTQPPPGGDTSGYGKRQATSQRGLHLAWASRAMERAEGGWEYRYPLGTGGAWARPIPLTRVYVTAPKGLDFRVIYPVHGADRSDYGDRLADYLGEKGYAVQYSSLGESYAIQSPVRAGVIMTTHLYEGTDRIWRVVYTQANPTADLQIIHDTKASDLVREELARYRRHTLLEKGSWGSAVLALVIWLVCWRAVMPRRLGCAYTWLDLTFWRDALVWPLLNGVVGAAFFVSGRFALYSNVDLMTVWGVLILIGLIVGIGYILVGMPVSFDRLSHLYGDRWRGVRSGYWIVAMLANFSYLILGLLYASLTDLLL